MSAQHHVRWDASRIAPSMLEALRRAMREGMPSTATATATAFEEFFQGVAGLISTALRRGGEGVFHG